MEFSAQNHIVQLCLRGMVMESGKEIEEASLLFHQAWETAQDDFEKFLAAHYLARLENDLDKNLAWLETQLHLAIGINNELVQSAFSPLYLILSKGYEEKGNAHLAKKYKDLAYSSIKLPTDKGPFYHGTKADLKIGEFLNPGELSNFKEGLKMNHIYFTASIDAAGLAAALAKGEGKERIYIIEPTNAFENDPNVTNKKFPGNPTRSYRSTGPLKIVGELTDWKKLQEVDKQKWKEKLDKNKGEIIN
jgi:rifampin ADP-ribosylating transferase